MGQRSNRVKQVAQVVCEHGKYSMSGELSRQTGHSTASLRVWRFGIGSVCAVDCLCTARGGSNGLARRPHRRRAARGQLIRFGIKSGFTSKNCTWEKHTTTNRDNVWFGTRRGGSTSTRCPTNRQRSALAQRPPLAPLPCFCVALVPARAANLRRRRRSCSH